MEKTGIVINTNNLAGYKDGKLVPAKEVRTYINGEWVNVKRILANENLKTVWEILEYLLQADDKFTMLANGGLVESNLSIVSKLNKPDGTYDSVEYTVSPSNISPNTGTTPKEHIITITQKTSNLQITATCIQESDNYYGIVYETPVVTSVTAATAEASGEDVMLTVKYTQKVIRQYASGNKEETISGTINPTINNGSAKISNVTRDGKYIKVPSADTSKYTSDRTVYTVTAYSFTVNGKTRTVSGVSIDVKQKANIVEYTTATDGGLNISANPVTVAPLNQSSTIAVTCYKNVRDVYTSGAYGDPVRENIAASLSCATGTFYPKSPIMGGNSTSFIPYENSTNDIIKHLITASVKIGNNTYTDSCIINQNPVYYKFEVKEKDLSFDSPGVNDYKIPIISSKNGFPLEITDNDIDVSGSSGLTYYVLVDDTNIEACRYYLYITLEYNGGSTRKYNITVTQPITGTNETITIHQAGSSSGGDGGDGGDGEDISSVTANVEQAYWSGNDIHYYVTFNGIENHIDYVTVEVNTSPYGDGTSYGEDRHDTVTSEGSVAGSITVYDQHTELYIVVRNMNGDVIGYKMVDLL